MTPPPEPRLAFGCMQFGDTADATASATLFAAARAAGIRHFDTAWLYAEGRSEALLGQLAAADPEPLQIATKIAYSGGAGPANLRAQFDESRRRLGMDRVDLLYLHRFDPDTPLEASFEVLARLQSDGAIARIGVSNFAAWQVMKAQAVCARLGTRIDAIQPMFSLVKRQAEVELLPMAADQGMVAYGYSPLGGGLLTGKYTGGASTVPGRLTENSRYAARYAPAAMHAAAAGLATLAAELGLHPATLAVAWVTAHPLRPVPIVSARSAAQLAPSLAAAGLVLSPEILQRIAALFPAPAPATDRIEEA